MQANKIFFDTTSSIDNNTETVYIFLRDTNIYTKTKRQSIFDYDMFNGCFMECKTFKNSEEVEQKAMSFAKEINARFVEVEEFIRIEKLTNKNRGARSFKIIEAMIRSY